MRIDAVVLSLDLGASDDMVLLLLKDLVGGFVLPAVRWFEPAVGTLHDNHVLDALSH